MKRMYALLLVVLAVVWPMSAPAQERILSYNSDITVFENGEMEVRETIRVRAEGRKIKRGIYRDFPTDYKDRLGNRYRVGFELLRVQRDGMPEDYFTKPRANGIRIYIGNKNRYLQHGEYTYTLVYRTNRQLGFFQNHDELYWNVTGNDWDFPIDEASASVKLPANVPAERVRQEAYTGYSGGKGQDYQASVDVYKRARFEATRSLKPREGLTIVVSWPKGYVSEPDTAEQMQYLLKDNRNLAAGLVGLLVLLVYYFVVWQRVGKDPEAGVIIPHYFPPESYSPAAMRFIRRMGYDHKAFTAAIVNLAVKGLLKISEEDNKYTLTKSGKIETELAAGESALLKRLFSKSSSIILKNTNHSRIKKAINAHRNSLKRDYEKTYFFTNTAWLIPGILITLGLLVAFMVLSPSADAVVAGVFMMVWLTGWTFGVIMLARKVFNSWRTASSGAGYGAAAVITLFALPFFGGEIAGIFMLSTVLSFSGVLVILAAVVINYVFYQLLKAPTRAGRKLLDKVEGFRMYLDVAEKEELKLNDPLEKTPQLFERYLPFALALDVEQRWAERFAKVFESLESQGEGYRPGWYYGSHWDSHNVGNFSSAVGGSLSSAISSSSTAPGSSSGGGGGGSSGGGGGGGGGGGW